MSTQMAPEDVDRFLDLFQGLLPGTGGVLVRRFKGDPARRSPKGLWWTAEGFNFNLYVSETHLNITVQRGRAQRNDRRTLNNRGQAEYRSGKISTGYNWLSWSVDPKFLAYEIAYVLTSCALVYTLRNQGKSLVCSKCERQLRCLTADFSRVPYNDPMYKPLPGPTLTHISYSLMAPARFVT